MIAPGMSGTVRPQCFRIVLVFICVCLCSSVANLSGGVRAAGTAADADEAMLKAAGIASDGPSLAAYIKRRTVTVADEAHLKLLVRQLGDDSFKRREDASRQLVMLGSRARSFLQAALKDSDPEIARRAQDCLERIAKGTSANTMSAAVRVLRAASRRTPPRFSSTSCPPRLRSVSRSRSAKCCRLWPCATARPSRCSSRPWRTNPPPNVPPPAQPSPARSAPNRDPARGT